MAVLRVAAAAEVRERCFRSKSLCLLLIQLAIYFSLSVMFLRVPMYIFCFVFLFRHNLQITKCTDIKCIGPCIFNFLFSIHLYKSLYYFRGVFVSRHHWEESNQCILTKAYICVTYQHQEERVSIILESSRTTSVNSECSAFYGHWLLFLILGLLT